MFKLFESTVFGIMQLTENESAYYTPPPPG
jgi:hypothetical protein